MTVQYKVVTDSSVSEFTKNVELALKEGWELVGGVSVVCLSAPYAVYNQALTRIVTRINN